MSDPNHLMKWFRRLLAIAQSILRLVLLAILLALMGASKWRRVFL